MKAVSKEHRKHAKLPRSNRGGWGKHELALLGAPCDMIRQFAEAIAGQLAPAWKIAFVDEEHKTPGSLPESALSVHLVHRQERHQVSFPAGNSAFLQHALFNDPDLVLINGNHFTAAQQVVFITDEKPLGSKAEKLSDVCLVLLKDGNSLIPEDLKGKLEGVPVLIMEDKIAVAGFFEGYLQKRIPALHGLVLAGGQSMRMGTDKGLLHYHGRPQRDIAYNLLKPLCREVYVSCNAQQSAEISLPKIEDRFLGIGPVAGLLSAFQSNPDVAWLCLACDLPYLGEKALEYLVAHRNPSALATAFIHEDNDLPEPLITIWEPRSYPVLLQALGEGHTCPRKLLMQSDIEKLRIPDTRELQNVNDVPAYELAVTQLHATVQNDSTL